MNERVALEPDRQGSIHEYLVATTALDPVETVEGWRQFMQATLATVHETIRAKRQQAGCHIAVERHFVEQVKASSATVRDHEANGQLSEHFEALHGLGIVTPQLWSGREGRRWRLVGPCDAEGLSRLASC
jgi:hypothetical protein